MKIQLARRQTFPKTQALWAGACKIELINQENLNRDKFPLKYLELVLETLSLITPIGTKYLKV